jgi:hypothetical protein
VVDLELDGVEPSAVVAWCVNALDILDAVHRNSDKVPFRVPPEALFSMAELVTGWRDAASAGNDLGRQGFDEEHVRLLVTYWFNITKLTEDERGRLGISFTPPDGRPFADALAAAVGAAMTASPSLADFAARLEAAWRECQPSFAAVARS